MIRLASSPLGYHLLLKAPGQHQILKTVLPTAVTSVGRQNKNLPSSAAAAIGSLCNTVVMLVLIPRKEYKLKKMGSTGVLGLSVSLPTLRLLDSSGKTSGEFLQGETKI